jgi:hypothetical protein
MAGSSQSSWGLGPAGPIYQDEGWMESDNGGLFHAQLQSAGMGVGEGRLSPYYLSKTMDMFKSEQTLYPESAAAAVQNVQAGLHMNSHSAAPNFDGSIMHSGMEGFYNGTQQRFRPGVRHGQLAADTRTVFRIAENAVLPTQKYDEPTAYRRGSLGVRNQQDAMRDLTEKASAWVDSVGNLGKTPVVFDHAAAAASAAPGPLILESAGINDPVDLQDPVHGQSSSNRDRVYMVHGLPLWALVQLDFTIQLG